MATHGLIEYDGSDIDADDTDGGDPPTLERDEEWCGISN